MAKGAPLIRVVAPARWAPDEVLEAFTETLETEGFAVEIDPQARLRDHQLAGEDAARAAALARALADPSVEIIWCARGGYGSARTLNHLPETIISKSKILIGYSDMTALQLSGQLSGVTHLHGPMPIDVTRPGGPERIKIAAGVARDLLGGKVVESDFSVSPVAAGKVSGPLAAANLCVLTTLLGTPHEPQWNGAILCLEDICEYLYALDRHFCHLAQSKAGAGIAGIVLGDFTDLEDNEIPWGEDVAAMAQRHFPGLPIASGLPMGHADRNAPFTQKAEAVLSVGAAAASLVIRARAGRKGEDA